MDESSRAITPPSLVAAEQALAASEDRYRRLVEACPDPIVVHAEGRIAFVNPAALLLLGADSPEDVLGRPIMDFVHPEFRPVVIERVRKMSEAGESVYLMEERLLRVDGSPIEVEVAGSPVVYQGKPAIQLVGRDVTQRKRDEEQRRRLQERVREARRRESLFRLAEGVAHQLDELSAALVEAADEALAEPRGAARSRGLVAVRAAGLRMAALTEQLLGFVGKRPIEGRPVDLSSLVLEISERLESEIGVRASLSYDLPAKLPRVQVDPPAVQRVVSGLVHNAADALGGRAGTISVQTRVVEVDEALLEGFQPPDALAPGRFVALQVRDNGCGMDAETRARSLEPFYSTKSPGRGLGLSEVLGLVQAQSGGLRVESAPGRGATVTVLFPATAAPERNNRNTRGRT
jgi:PAS domain S-box-containing protein